MNLSSPFFGESWDRYERVSTRIYSPRFFYRDVEQADDAFGCLNLVIHSRYRWDYFKETVFFVLKSVHAQVF